MSRPDLEHHSSSAAPEQASAIGDPVLWHEAECGGYAADLAIWEQLARDGGGTVLDLGAGSGRVSLHLARRGLEVIAVDSEPLLIEALRAKAAAEGLRVQPIAGDVRELGGVPISVATVIAPMQLLHLMGGSAGRARLLEGLLSLTEPGGRLHAALLADMPALGSFTPEPMPDVRESEGMWVHASIPLAVEIDEHGLDIVRLRQLVAPDGTLSEEHNVVRLERLTAAELEAEAAALGWQVLERTPVGETEDHVASEIVSLEAPGMSAAPSPALRLLALYPEQMNIYADRGNVLFLQRRCEWRGLGFSYAAAGPGEAFDPAAHDLIYIGGGQDRDQRAVAADLVASKARPCARRSATAPRCSPSAAATSCSATATSSATKGSPGLGIADLRDRARARPAADRQRRDRGRGRRGQAGPRRLREPRRPHLPGDGGDAARPRAQRPWQQRRRRARGRPHRERVRDLSARPAAAEERVAGGRADRAGDRAPNRLTSPSSNRLTTTSRTPPTPAPAPPQQRAERLGP